MKLPDAPEPQWLKEKAKMQRKEDPEWDSDSLVIWYANRLPSYLWTECGWGRALKAEGFWWRGFPEVLSIWKTDFIKWARKQQSWDALIRTLKADFQN